MTNLNVTLTNEQVEEILNSGKQQIINACVESLKSHLSWSVRNELEKELSPIIKDFAQKEIIPELVEMLAGQKSVILECVAKQANEIGLAFVQSLVDHLAKKLGTDYQRKEIFKTMFG